MIISVYDQKKSMSKAQVLYRSNILRY